jgi:hypothetical protein
MNKNIILLFVCAFLTQSVQAEVRLTEAQGEEMHAIITNLNYGYKNLTYRAAVAEKMLQEANYFAERLKLPLRRPILMADIQNCSIPLPWICILPGTNRFPDTIYGTHIYDPEIPRESRLRALKISVDGSIITTNYEFVFTHGRLREIMRLDAPNTEYYARRLDELIGQPSLIDTNGAYQLATQWLAAVDIDVAALEQSSGKWITGGHTVNQLHYMGRGMTNHVTLPLYYVDFGSQHFPADGSMKAFDEPLVTVEILGTTKELQELTIGKNTLYGDIPYSRRPVLLITNALDLLRTTNPPMKQLQSPTNMQTNTDLPRPRRKHR